MRAQLLGLSIECDRPLRATDHSGETVDVAVFEAADPIDEALEWVGAEDWPKIARKPGRIVFWFDDDAVFESDLSGTTLRYQLLREIDEHTFAHELVDGVLPRIISLRGGLALHGGSVAGRGGAVVFVGASGAGKSTIAAALTTGDRLFMGDDTAALSTIDGVDHVIPSGTSLRLYKKAALAALTRPVLGPPMAHWSEKRLVEPVDSGLVAAAEPVSLRAVVELTAGGGPPTLVRLDGGSVFEMLARNSFDLPNDRPTAGVELLERWGPLAGRVEGYRLTRRLDLGELDAVCELLGPLLDVDA